MNYDPSQQQPQYPYRPQQTGPGLPPQYQQPGVPPQYPYQQVPPQQPPRKPSFFGRKVGCLPMWALLLVIAVVACGIIGIASSASNSATTNTQLAATTQSNNNQATQPASTTAPTQAPTTTTKWTTTHTYKGTGSKKTGSISVPDDWKIVWSCDHTSFDNIDYNVIIIVYNTDGSIADSGVNSMCTKKNTHDETEIHTSGNVYLDITSEGAWNIQIQELK